MTHPAPPDSEYPAGPEDPAPDYQSGPEPSYAKQSAPSPGEPLAPAPRPPLLSHEAKYGLVGGAMVGVPYGLAMIFGRYSDYSLTWRIAIALLCVAVTALAFRPVMQLLSKLPVRKGIHAKIIVGIAPLGWGLLTGGPIVTLAFLAILGAIYLALDADTGDTPHKWKLPWQRSK